MELFLYKSVTLVMLVHLIFIFFFFLECHYFDVKTDPCFGLDFSTDIKQAQ